MRQVRSHYSMEGVEEKQDAPTQRVGQSTDKVLLELGYSAEAISRLVKAQVLKI